MQYELQVNQFGHPSSECRAHAISGGKVKGVFRSYTIMECGIGTKKRGRPTQLSLFLLSHLPLITTSRQVRVNTALAIGACPRRGILIYQTCMANSGEILLRSWMGISL